jgi:hypothetical protein
MFALERLPRTASGSGDQAGMGAEGTGAVETLELSLL